MTAAFFHERLRRFPDRKDRSPVYEAEWQILERYPDVTFDFNVLLLPAGREALETESADYVYKR